MILARCIHTSLSQIPSAAQRGRYEHLVTPIDLNLGLILGDDYQLVGLSTSNGVAMVFVRELKSNRLLSVYPAPLFEVDWTPADPDYALRISKDTGAIDLVLRPLTLYSDWFERYCDDDPEIVRLVNSLD